MAAERTAAARRRLPGGSGHWFPVGLHAA